MNSLVSLAGKGDEDRDEVPTPKYLYDHLDEIYHFDHDPCPLGARDSGTDGLSTAWGERTFVNPPYSATLRWVKKAIREYQEGKLVVMLVPARTNSTYWHRFVFPHASEIHFLSKITFLPYKRACPFPVAVVVFDGAIKDGLARKPFLVRSNTVIKKRTRPYFTRFSLR